MYQIFLMQISFIRSDWVELDFCSFQNKIALNFKSQVAEKFELFSQGIYNFQNFRNETLVIVGYKYANLFSFATFNMKLWLKEENILHDLNELQRWFACKSRSSLIHNFIFIIAILEIFT